MLCCSVVFSPFGIAVIALGEERANLSAFRTFFRFAIVWFCLFPLHLGVWKGLRFVIVALLGLFSYLFYMRMGLHHCRPNMFTNMSCFQKLYMVVRYGQICLRHLYYLCKELIDFAPNLCKVFLDIQILM